MLPNYFTAHRAPPVTALGGCRRNGKTPVVVTAQNATPVTARGGPVVLAFGSRRWLWAPV